MRASDLAAHACPKSAFSCEKKTFLFKRVALESQMRLRSQSSRTLVSKRLSFRDCHRRCAARVPARYDDDALVSWHVRLPEEPKQATVPARLSQKLRFAEVFWGFVQLRRQLQVAVPSSWQLLRCCVRIPAVWAELYRGQEDVRTREGAAIQPACRSHTESPTGHQRERDWAEKAAVGVV